jgi:hypothetical protein
MMQVTHSENLNIEKQLKSMKMGAFRGIAREPMKRWLSEKVLAIREQKEKGIVYVAAEGPVLEIIFRLTVTNVFACLLARELVT